MDICVHDAGVVEDDVQSALAVNAGNHLFHLVFLGDIAEVRPICSLGVEDRKREQNK
jgi:hypothetical protein